MPELLTIVIVIGLGVAAGGGFVLFQQQNQATQRDAFQALAARRGWSLTVSDQKLGRPGVLRLTSRSGLGWTAQTRRSASDDNASTALTTEFEAEEPSWADGVLIIGPALPAQSVDAAQGVLSALDTPEGQKWLSRLLGDDVAKYSAVLRHYPTNSAITVFATADPTHKYDFGDLARPIAAWDSQVSGDRGRPIVILGPEGMRLRLRHGTKRADRMEKFVDLALEMGRML